MTPSITAEAGEPPEKVKVLIVTGFDVDSHKWKESSSLVRTILEKSGRFDVSVSTSKEDFASLHDYAAVVLCYGFWKEPDPSERAKVVLVSGPAG